MIEFIYRLIGLRRNGALEELKRDPRNWKAEEHLDYAGAEKLIRGVDFVDLETIRYQDQGLTAHCVAYMIAHAMTIMIRLNNKGYSGVIRGRDVAKLLIDVGILTKRGAYLLAAIKYITKEGVTDTTGKKWKPTGFVEVKRDFETFFKTIALGRPVMTGSRVKKPYHDAWLFWIPSKDGGGHAQATVSAYREREIKGGTFLNVVGWLNSWYKWGLKKHGTATGMWFIDKPNLKHLFRSYSFIDVIPAE